MLIKMNQIQKTKTIIEKRKIEFNVIKNEISK